MLSKIQTSISGRRLFEDSLHENGKTVTQCREEITRSIASLDDNLKRIEGMILGHKDARTLLQKIAGKLDERLSELHQAYTNTHLLAAEERQKLLKIEERWGKEGGYWERQAESMNAQTMDVQERSASGLRDIREVLCGSSSASKAILCVKKHSLTSGM